MSPKHTTKDILVRGKDVYVACMSFVAAEWSDKRICTAVSADAVR